MKAYILKKSKYLAIQYKGDNREKVIDALGIPRKELCQAWVNEDTKERYLDISDPECMLGHITQGQWIVTNKDKSHYLVVDPADFKENYEELP